MQHIQGLVTVSCEYTWIDHEYAQVERRVKVRSVEGCAEMRKCAQVSPVQGDKGHASSQC